MVWHCTIWIRDLDTKKIKTEVFGKQLTVMLKENEEGEMVRQVTNEYFLECIGERRTFLNNTP